MAELAGRLERRMGRDVQLVAYDTDEQVRLNQVKAVERGVDQLYNSFAELTAFGLELPEVRRRGDELNARRDLAAPSVDSACSDPSAHAASHAC